VSLMYEYGLRHRNWAGLNPHPERAKPLWGWLTSPQGLAL
jgi:hypothetical protein